MSDRKDGKDPFDWEDEELEATAGSETDLNINDLLAPPSLTLTLADGNVLHFADRNSFSPSEEAKLTKLSELINKNLDILKSSPNNTAAEQRVEQYVSRFLRFVLPDIDDETLNGLSYGQKGRILQWYSEQNAKLADQKK